MISQDKKPLCIPSPKPKRLLKRLRMTLIVGAECLDGMLFCSDREENTPQGGKRSVQKLFEKSGSNWSMVIGTAGHGPLCEVVIKRIMGAAGLDTDFAAKHEQTITKVLVDLHNQYVFPYPDKDRRISLIIGIHDKTTGERYLYRTEEEILYPQNSYTCAGAGEDIANYFLNKLYSRGFRESELKCLLLFIMREAKDCIQGVGKETETITLHNNGLVGNLIVERVADAKLPHLSQCITEFWKQDKFKQ